MGKKSASLFSFRHFFVALLLIIVLWLVSGVVSTMIGLNIVKDTFTMGLQIFVSILIPLSIALLAIDLDVLTREWGHRPERLQRIYSMLVICAGGFVVGMSYFLATSAVKLLAIPVASKELPMLFQEVGIVSIISFCLAGLTLVISRGLPALLRTGLAIFLASYTFILLAFVCAILT